MPESHEHDYAIIDLGSNSFHLHVVRVVDGQIRYLDRYREVVRLAEGITPDGTITPEKQKEALAVLNRYGDRVQGFDSANVRAIGTSAFRHSRKAESFLVRAEGALGYPIDIISGREEARLIYLGIVSEDGLKRKQRFIIDIGGGSTEFIFGGGDQPQAISSVELGNISLTRTVFSDAKIDEDLFHSTVADITETLRTLEVNHYRKQVDVVLGASGTLKLVASMLQNLEWGNGEINKDGLDKLARKWVKGKRKLVRTAGLPPEREGTFIGALALLKGIFKAYGFERIETTRAGVRQGLLHDMLRLTAGEDRKRHTLNTMMERHRVDRDQSRRVDQFCRTHLSDIAPWLPYSPLSASLLLGWASALHEIGLTINYSGYHKHGAYILKNADMPGFTRLEQGRIAFLIYNHRKRIKLEQLDKEDAVPLPLLFLFRLSWLLYRRRRSNFKDPVRGLKIEDSRFTVVLAPGWLHAHPLVERQFSREIERWQEVGVVYKVVDALE